MVLVPFATAAQMEARSQGHIPVTTPFLEEALKAATKRIRNHCGWHIAKTFSTVYRARRSDGDILWLPSLHVTSVDALEVNGATINLTESPVDFITETGETDIRGRNIRVTFTHGYEEVPDDIVDMTLMIASRALGSPLGLTREQASGVSVTHSVTGVAGGGAVSGGTVLIESELAALEHYRLGWQP